MSRRKVWRVFRHHGLFAALRYIQQCELLADLRTVNRLLDAKLRGTQS